MGRRHSFLKKKTIKNINVTENNSKKHDGN